MSQPQALSMKMSAIETKALPPGTTVKHYVVVDSIGLDGHSRLYRAECARTHRAVLLYEYLPRGLAPRGPGGSHGTLSGAISAQATRLRAAALLGHAALPTLDDIWQHDGALYAVSRWLPGRSLLTELASTAAPVDASRLRAWARIIGDALAVLHRHGLLHGNLCPDTIRLLDSGGLMLPPPGDEAFDADAPAWIAPEQHRLSPKPVATGPWTDVYQLSALMHHAITGLAPPAVMRRWEGQSLERLTVMSGRYPEAVLAATRRGLSMQAPARQQSIAQWLEEAGWPDRRERTRDAEPGGEATPDEELPLAPDAWVCATAADGLEHATPGVTPHDRSAPLRKPLRDDGPDERALTPAWVWWAVLLALTALVGILLAT